MWSVVFDECVFGLHSDTFQFFATYLVQELHFILVRLGTVALLPLILKAKLVCCLDWCFHQYWFAPCHGVCVVGQSCALLVRYHFGSFLPGCVHMFASSWRLFNSVCHLCVLVCLVCWHTTASVPDAAQDTHRAKKVQTLYSIVKEGLATSPTDPQFL